MHSCIAWRRFRMILSIGIRFGAIVARTKGILRTRHLTGGHGTITLILGSSSLRINTSSINRLASANPGACFLSLSVLQSTSGTGAVVQFVHRRSVSSLQSRNASTNVYGATSLVTRIRANNGSRADGDSVEDDRIRANHTSLPIMISLFSCNSQLS